MVLWNLIILMKASNALQEFILAQIMQNQSQVCYLHTTHLGPLKPETIIVSASNNAEKNSFEQLLTTLPPYPFVIDDVRPETDTDILLSVLLKLCLLHKYIISLMIVLDQQSKIQQFVFIFLRNLGQLKEVTIRCTLHIGHFNVHES